MIEPIPKLRGDYARIQRDHGDKRPPERLRAHFVLERDLARRLKSVSKAERAAIYTEVYNELFRSLPDHPQHSKRNQPSGRDVRQPLAWLRPFLDRDSSFVEIGCGDAAASFALAEHTREVIGADVQQDLIDFSKAPSNFRFVKVVDGTTLPLPSASVDVVSSDQLLEHLHPEDAIAQLREVARILKPGGVYVCTTPSAATGPHDITMYFGYCATGLHLHEYTYRELQALFRAAGFTRLQPAVRMRGRQAIVPLWLLISIEWLFLRLPRSLRTRLAAARSVQSVFGINAIART